MIGEALGRILNNILATIVAKIPVIRAFTWYSEFLGKPYIDAIIRESVSYENIRPELKAKY